MRAIAALVVTLVLVGGCGSSEASLGETIEGVWTTDLWGTYEVFLDDGTYGVGHTLESATPTEDGFAEVSHGTWSVDGNILTRATDLSANGCPGKVATYEVEALNNGDRLELAVIEDDCADQRLDMGSGLTRYSDNP
jgi:hypothetical protein